MFPAFSNDAEHKNNKNRYIIIKTINNYYKGRNKDVTKSVKSVRPRWQDGLAGGRSTVWCSLSIARWPIAGRSVVYSLTGEYQDTVPEGGQCWQWCGWLHHSSHPGTPQQGEQIGPPLHGRTQPEQPSSSLSLLAAHAPVCWLLLPGSVGSRDDCDTESRPLVQLGR